jgi:hypothetical protein
MELISVKGAVAATNKFLTAAERAGTATERVPEARSVVASHQFTTPGLASVAFRVSAACGSISGRKVPA